MSALSIWSKTTAQLITFSLGESATDIKSEQKVGGGKAPERDRQGQAVLPSACTPKMKSGVMALPSREQHVPCAH